MAFEREIEKMSDGKIFLLMVVSGGFALAVQLYMWNEMLSISGFFIASLFGALVWIGSLYILLVLIGAGK